MINLSRIERNHFASYLEQEAEANKGIIKQMGVMFNPDHPLLRAYKIKTAAYAIIAKELRSTEEQTIQE